MNIDIEKRIKELQKDSKYFFKQTEEIIDEIYRLALQDISNDLEDTITQEVNDSINDKFIFKTNALNESRDLKEELDDALNVIKDQDEKIESQEKTIKKLNNQIHDLKEKQIKTHNSKYSNNSTNEMDNHFQSGMVTGLKYSMMALEGNNIEDAYALIVNKYNSVARPQKNIWP